MNLNVLFYSCFFFAQVLYEEKHISFFDSVLTVHLSIISAIKQLNAQNLLL